jgi:two-component system response regulator CpxR
LAAEKATRVLVVDDDVKLCRLIKEYLEPMGYRVEAAHQGARGLDLALSGGFDALILDVMMPGMDGFEFLRRLRNQSDLPVLMLSARGEETDRIVGLELGADDYLPKTFSTRELLARLRAVTRRTRRDGAERVSGDDSTLVFGDLRVDQGGRMVTVADRPVDLTPFEYEILVALARAPGRVLTRDQLLDAAAGRDYEIFDRSVDVHVSSLRRKLGDDPRRPVYIKTVRAAGYMFVVSRGSS